MEWLSCLKEAIAYMDDNLLDINGPEDVASHVSVSSMYLQRGFQILTGITLGEYIRNRKLYLAAVELCSSPASVLDVALKYGYETQASFDKAFARFHGVTPRDVKKGQGSIRTFQKMSVRIAVKGGFSLPFRIEKKGPLTFVGYQKAFDYEDCREAVGTWWDEFRSHADEQPPYAVQHHVGEYGLCFGDIGPVQFNYVIAGLLSDADTAAGKDCPEGMLVREVPAGEWAVFECRRNELFQMCDKFWNEWLPGNEEYELTDGCVVEWYSQEDGFGPNQRCALWYPVKRR